MKKAFLVSMTFVVLAAGTSCTKSSSGGGGSTSGSFTYKVDGVAVTADSATATLYTLGVAPFNRMIDVFVFKGSTTMGSVTIPNQVMEMHFLPKSGAQTVSPAFTTAWLTYSDYAAGNPVPTGSYDGTAGAFNLSLCDTTAKKLSGTFSFTGTATIGSGTKYITEGNLVINKITVQ